MPSDGEAEVAGAAEWPQVTLMDSPVVLQFWQLSLCALSCVALSSPRQKPDSLRGRLRALQLLGLCSFVLRMPGTALAVPAALNTVP